MVCKEGNATRQARNVVVDDLRDKIEWPDVFAGATQKEIVLPPEVFAVAGL